MTLPDDPHEDPADVPAEPTQPYEPVPVEPAQPEPLQPEPAQPEPLQPEPAQPEPAQPEPLQPEPVPVEPAEPLHPEPVPVEPVQPEPAPPAPTAEMPAPVPAPSLSDRLAQLEPDDDGPLFDEDPFDDEAYAGQPYAGQPYAGQPYAGQPYADEQPLGQPPVDVLPVADPVAVAAPPVEASTAEPVPDAADTSERTPTRERPAGRRVSVPVVALLLMTALMAAATTYLWLQVREHDRTEQARRTGLEASRDAARLLFSYDYRTLDKDFSTGRALTTGEFRKQYDKTTTKVVSDVAKQYKAVVKADVVSAGVVRATPEQVVTIVYVNQVTTSTRVTGEKVDLSRVKMTLAKVGGRWLVTAVNAL